MALCFTNITDSQPSADYFTVLKIKKTLIHNAKVKQSYAKLKERGNIDRNNPPASRRRSENDAPAAPANEPHPQSELQISQSLAQFQPIFEGHSQGGKSWAKKPRPIPFEKEAREAQQKKEEAQKRQEAKEEANRQRQQKFEERERFRKAMAKARVGGRDGQRKLGRESKILLERVKRIVSG